MSLSEIIDYDRKLIFITGSNYSGKSLVGHMIALNETCLYNYSSISPKDYFNLNGNLKSPKEQTLNKLKRDIKKICHYLNGGIHKNEGERWLREDNLYHYDYIRFEIDLSNSISKQTKLAEFYLLWDYFIRQNRLDGHKTKFSIFEVENFYEFKNYIIKYMEKNEIMTDENQLSSEEIKKLRNLIDTEEIKKLRLKYSYHMDARELDDLMDVLDSGADRRRNALMIMAAMKGNRRALKELDKLFGIL